MPRVHVETAIGQFTGTRTLLADRARARRSADEPGAARPRSSRPGTRRSRRSTSTSTGCGRRLDRRPTGDPRLGAERFSRKLALTLDTASDADAVLARAEADLERLEELIAETAARLDDGDTDGRVRRVLDRLAADGEVDDDTIVGLCVDAMAADHRVRPRARPGHRPRRPGRDHRDAGDPPRRRGRLLRPARPARDRVAADLLRGRRRPRRTGPRSGCSRSTASTTRTCCTT